MGERYDLVTIGAGPAGEKGAAQAAYFGKRVAVVDRLRHPGGATVASTGIPTKTLRETALYVTGFRNRDVYGLSLELDRETVLERLISRRSEVASTMARAVDENLRRHGIRYIQGEARLGPDRTVLVTVDGTELSLQANVILIASGSRPFRPPTVPFDDPDVHDSEEVLGIRRLPGSMVVVGGGPAGCEYASIFTALGTDVTLIDTAERILPFMDEEISRLLAETFERMGMRVLLGAGVATIDRSDGRLRVRTENGEVLHPEQVLFAAGRSGNTEGLGLEKQKVELDARGRVKVDETFRTTADGIYAAGDVIGPPSLASVSMEQGRVAICHAFGIPFKETVDPLPPSAVYSIPESAMVGLTEEAARAEGVDGEVGRGWFAGNAKATISGFTEGLVKLVFRRDTRALLGVHILGDGASELIHTGQAAIHAGGTIDQFIHTTFCTPTRSEAFKYAAYDGLQRLSGRSLGPPSSIATENPAPE
ncbi:MAG TPA: Si-specific NAD(P)(+) transhydrogenase [Actinomycetota bacterium]|nr:Si-specific NAD(P)(+) transhydrogenase [Actinomycetota bacterium]